ncbi:MULTISPECIES: SAM-dependent methyltransferase [unclassified Plantactinospora]|uniref:SAM-dependent methyltransferase n=1 Tax=unclassified Plantactinospora TaxID=2631981 RepID=UPI000D15F275|nr:MULTISPECIES: SAM-dependent methyltransferase [unclassified Plantactinospora]AVT32924.1 translation initiation factor IF-2 [Plantactinospora sp. BC1]AVT37728.1 translation initiation factor IF-2 [Plantactinospora sp. BB1]
MTEDREFRSDSKLDTTVPHSARIWNYWLGGKDNFAVDRAVGDEVIAHIPDIPVGARSERAFLKRVVRFLVEDAGIRQFLDVGTGLPSAENTHEVAQALDPGCRVVYIDNDPLVMVHARALLNSAPEGICDYVEADLRQPDTILASARQTLDFSQPIGLMLLGVVNHLMDDDVAYGSVAQLVRAMPAGSYLVLTHSTAEIHGEPMLRVMRETTERGGTPIRARTKVELERFFDGLDLLEPGVVTCSRWRPDPESDEPEVYLFGGVGRIG